MTDGRDDEAFFGRNRDEGAPPRAHAPTDRCPSLVREQLRHRLLRNRQQPPSEAIAVTAIIGSAAARIIESLPRVPCIELVGDVFASETEDFAPGSSVMAHGFRTGIAFFGIVANAEWPVRRRVREKLASEWRPDLERLGPHVRTIDLDALAEHCERQLGNATRGRTLVAF